MMRTLAKDPMSPDEFRAWLGRLNLSYAAAARALGMGVRILYMYAKGALPIPVTVALACELLEIRFNQKAA